MFTVCPASGKKLKLKDLTSLKFTATPPEDKGKYMDPITRATLTNSSKLVVLKPTGTVLLEESYERCVKPDGVYEGVEISELNVKDNVLRHAHGWK